VKFKTAVFHWTARRVGGGEILASYLGKALNCKVYTIGKSPLGFEDLAHPLPRPYRLLKRVRSFEYLLWSMIDITELGDFDVVITSGSTPRALITPEHTMHVNYCLAEDTKLLVRVDGMYRILPIKSVKEGMEVLSVNEKGEVFFNKIIAKKFTDYREDMHRVRVRGGREVVCTSDHKFYVYNKFKKRFEVVECKDLIPNVHFVPLIRKIPEPKRYVTSLDVAESLKRHLDNPEEKVIPLGENVVLTPVISIEKESGRYTYDITVSGNHLFALANGLIVHNCHSPPRWLYDLWHYRRKRWGRLGSVTLPLIAEFLRIWDSAVDRRVDYYFTNSEVIAHRLWKYLKRESVVLYPPIEFDKYRSRESEDFILFLSRLSPEKRVEVAIDACLKAGQKIIVAGTGVLEKKLRKKYGGHPLVEFRGFVSEKEKIDLLSRCKALIFPAIGEDFGIVPVEALASGKPVVVADTGFPPVLLSKTGTIENRSGLKICRGGIIANEKNMAMAIKLLDSYDWDSEYLRDFARRFDFKYFRTSLLFHLKIWKEEFDRRRGNYG